MKLDVSFYDIRIKNLFRYTLQLLSVHGEYINLYCAKKRKIISILLSDKMFYDIAPYRMIINKIKYPAINFLDIYKVGTFTAEKINFITTKGKCLECIILNAEKFTPKEYLPTIHNKYSLNNFLYTLRYLQMYKSPVKLLPEIEKMISKTIEALRNENTGVLDMCITNGIGLGMGSTPEFDDFLSGVIFMLQWYVNFFSESKKEKIKKLLSFLYSSCKKNLNKTTLFSRVFISQLLSYEWPLKMVEFMKGLSTNDTYRVKISYKYILNDGNTSGKMFLYGIITTAWVIYEKHNL